MLVALLLTAFGVGVHLPADEGRVNPAALATTAPFNKPGVHPVAPGRYEVRMLAGIWFFAPNEIRVPAGSTVEFIATSRDVVHGLLIQGANVNVMLLPGQVSRVTARFERPGEYPFVCHEYCGIAHHTMWGRVIVEPRPATQRPTGS
ncbi:MAG: cytochrome c oxidase subunit II [Candidatus Tectomicrobia bacterium]|nr:cytochrome c oxidase subunit II [Candidatus Tectomicrobia bacterium]